MKILAVDYGDSRTGLATCDRTEFLTTAITPQITLKARNKVACAIGRKLVTYGWHILRGSVLVVCPCRLP